MYVKLIEGDLDAVLVELCLDCLGHVEVDRPVVGVVHPCARLDLDGGCAVSSHSYEGGRILEDELVLLEDVHNDRLCLLAVGGISDREFEVNTAGVFFGVVDDIAVCKRTVRNVNDLIIACNDLCACDMNIGNHARDALSLNEVVYFKGSGNENEHTARKIGESSVDSETDNNTKERTPRGALFILSAIYRISIKRQMPLNKPGVTYTGTPAGVERTVSPCQWPLKVALIRGQVSINSKT